MAGTLSPQTISTKQLELAQRAEMLARRVGDVLTVTQQIPDLRSRMREFRTSGSVGAPASNRWGDPTTICRKTNAHESGLLSILADQPLDSAHLWCAKIR